jgi:dihydrolipoamide dehydrogenase
MNHEAQTAQVVVVGAGPGGYAAAFMAADLGLDVTLIGAEEHPGGVCLYRGCIPSKTLLHVAAVLREARRASHWGVRFREPDVDLGRIREWSGEVVRKLTGGLGLLARQRSVRYLQGRASFLDARTLKVDVPEQGEKRIVFEKAILATGSRPAVLPGITLQSPRIMDSSAALALREIPENLLIVGGGYIGLELGTVYGALGASITLVEMTSGLLPGVDRDLVAILSRNVESVFRAVQLDTKAVGMEEEADGIRVRLQGVDGGESDRRYDAVLVCVGRRPNSEIPGLHHTKVTVDERGFIVVDDQRRTADPDIFAIGDVAGEPMLAHKASHEGRIAAEVIAGRKVAFEPRAIPAVVYTDPEIAWCGLTETRAREEDRTVRSVRFPWGASGRAATLGRQDGVTKLILEPGTGRVLGVGIAGPAAGELIAEGVLAVEMGALASDLTLSVHPHPTLSETLMEAAEAFEGQSTHVFRPRRK